MMTIAKFHRMRIFGFTTTQDWLRSHPSTPSRVSNDWPTHCFRNIKFFNAAGDKTRPWTNGWVTSYTRATAPVDLAYVAYADSTVLSWVSASIDPSNYQLIWGYEGFTPGDTNQLGTIDGVYLDSLGMVTITGLSDTINYEYYVTDICGFGDQSVPAGPQMFTGPPPANDLCINAIALECGTSVPGNTVSTA